MIKNIASYGIILMTTLIVYRAYTIDHKMDPKIHYQRETDSEFIIDNLVLRSALELSNTGALVKLATFNSPILPRLELIEKQTRSSSIAGNYANENNDQAVNTTSNKSEEITIEIENLNEDPKLSLERESTINSNLSTLFPRQRILQRPNSNLSD